MTILIGNVVDNDDTVSLGPAGEIRMMEMVALESGEINTASIKLASISSEIRIAIYAQAGGSPGALLGWIPVPLETPVDEVVTLAFPPVELVQGQSYWIGTQSSDGTGVIYRDSSQPALSLNFDSSDVYGTAPRDPFVKASGISSTPRVLYFSSQVTPSIRKGGTATFDKPDGIGNIVSATLNGNAITVDSQTVDNFTVTDSDGSIATSGTYDLVVSNDDGTPITKTISVQVNVVGLPSNNASKDSVAFADLTDIQGEFFDAARAHIDQQNDLTCDVSGDIPPIDLSGTTGAVGETLKVSLYSPSVASGITFEQALELI